MLSLPWWWVARQLEVNDSRTVSSCDSQTQCKIPLLFTGWKKRKGWTLKVFMKMPFSSLTLSGSPPVATRNWWKGVCLSPSFHTSSQPTPKFPARTKSAPCRLEYPPSVFASSPSSGQPFQVLISVFGSRVNLSKSLDSRTRKVATWVNFYSQGEKFFYKWF